MTSETYASEIEACEETVYPDDLSCLPDASAIGRRPPGIASIGEIVEEARNGRMFILADDVVGETQGHLVIPAQMATPDAINFMARYGRGLVCLALTKERVEALSIPMMTRTGISEDRNAFSVSIEAREGVSTGISAADRARTIAVAIDAGARQADIVTPGHVFPLVAKPGGVLVRAGHTEAAIDVSRLAGLNPSGVVCGIINAQGATAGLDDLMEFAAVHGLKVATIRDLIAYRLRHDHLVEEVASTQIDSPHGGNWELRIYRNRIDGSESLALLKGAVNAEEPVTVRVHTASIPHDLLGCAGPRKSLLQRAMSHIGELGSGLVLVLPVPAAQGGLEKMIFNKGGIDMRDYGIGAQILADLGVQRMVLLSNSDHNLVALSGYGLAIVGQREIP